MIDEVMFDVNVTKAMHRIEDLYWRTGGACYLSFSGGKDSTIVLALIKLCEELGTIPKDAIPAVFCDTKIELGATVEFVKWVQSEWYGNVQIIKTEMLFSHVLKKFGKPAISKLKAELLRRWQKNSQMKTARFLVSNEKKHSKTKLSNKYMHMVSPDFDIKISNECCNQMKKKPFYKYAEDYGMLGYMSGLRAAEGGIRETTIANRGANVCTHIKKDGTIEKNPIVDWTDEMCDIFVDVYDIPLSRAYTEYGLNRTGCFCCPFARDVDQNLENLFRNEPNRYKAALFYLKDVYIAQGVELPFDPEYMAEFAEKWKEYEVMRYEMLKKYRPGCQLVKKFEKSQEQQGYTQLEFDVG